jgi:hypothetical protein
MSEIRTFFRHCPACGRRFEIRLENKTLIREDHTTSTLPVESHSFTATGYPNMTSMPLTVGEGEPIVTDTEEFQYTYKCKHCGHEWSEKHDEEHKER